MGLNMRKLLFVLSVALAAFCNTAVAQNAAFKAFYVYSDDRSAGNHFIPSGWMGDHPDIALDQSSTETFYSGLTCIKITYSNKASKNARWTGVWWQEPAKNWGTIENAGFNLTGAKKLTFWARGKNGGERIEEFKIGGITGAFGDSDTAGIGPIVLTQEWKQYTIGLSGKNLKKIIGGFAWSANLDNNPQGCTFYLDEIKYE
jgi:hypothetical protein